MIIIMCHLSLDLRRISANATFGRVTLGATRRLEDHITRENSASNCLRSIVMFNSSVPPVVDDLYFDTLMRNITRADFLGKLKRSLASVRCDDLSLSELTADEILPGTINGIDYGDLASTKQNLTGELTVNVLETEVLDAETINGMSLEELRRSLTRAMSLYDDESFTDVDPPIEIGSLRVLGRITVSSINDIDVYDIYDESSMATVIFRDGASIGDLTVTGFVNGLNLSRIADDAVRRTDRNVRFTGRKTFDDLTCDYLDARFVNDHLVDDVLSADREQTLKGPVTVTGTSVFAEMLEWPSGYLYRK